MEWNVEMNSMYVDEGKLEQSLHNLMDRRSTVNEYS
jgi:hypothetical protein